MATTKNCRNLVLVVMWWLSAQISAVSIALATVISTGDFNKDFHVIWSPTHVNTTADGHMRNLSLDQESGSGFASNDVFLFGEFTMQIKLVPGYSAGTVTAFYLTSNQPRRDEIDFEFLGNVIGQPYTVQTNIYVDGFDDREERINLWFDPTQSFHNYTILWNVNQIVFMVDWVPIRVYRNYVDKTGGGAAAAAAFPRLQPMTLEATIWDGSSWATRGGKDKVDWSKVPYVASFGRYKIDACVCEGEGGDDNYSSCRSTCSDVNSINWWNLPESSGLTTLAQRRLLRWVRKYHLSYDYCLDPARFQNKLPRECTLPKF